MSSRGFPHLFQTSLSSRPTAPSIVIARPSVASAKPRSGPEEPEKPLARDPWVDRWTWIRFDPDGPTWAHLGDGCATKPDHGRLPRAGTTVAEGTDTMRTTLRAALRLLPLLVAAPLMACVADSDPTS